MMTSSPKYFYKFAKSKRRVREPIGPFSKDGKIIQQEEAEILVEEFEEAFRKPKEGEETDVSEEYYTNDEDVKEGARRISKIPITVEAVWRAIKRMTSMASGPSGIDPLITKRLGPVLVPYLVEYYRDMINEGRIPVINLLNFISPILKPGKGPEDPASYRPVA